MPFQLEIGRTHFSRTFYVEFICVGKGGVLLVRTLSG